LRKTPYSKTTLVRKPLMDLIKLGIWIKSSKIYKRHYI
jgi:hypothetical protein